MEDRDWALGGGPWMVQGHYLTIREWVPDFHLSEAKIVGEVTEYADGILGRIYTSMDRVWIGSPFED